MFKYFRIIILLFTLHYSLFHAYGQIDSSKVIYKVILKNGGVFNGSTDNKQLYVVTDYARLTIYLWDIDSVDFGILPDYSREMKIVKLLTKLNTGNKASKIFIYNKLLSSKIGALPIIRNYIKIKPQANIHTDPSDMLTPENLLKDLMHKYQVDSSFIDKDIICMQRFKIGGILFVKKRRALLKFDNFVFPRDEIKKLIVLHKKNKV